MVQVDFWLSGFDAAFVTLTLRKGVHLPPAECWLSHRAWRGVYISSWKPFTMIFLGREGLFCYRTIEQVPELG